MKFNLANLIQGNHEDRRSLQTALIRCNARTESKEDRSHLIAFFDDMNKLLLRVKNKQSTIDVTTFRMLLNFSDQISFLGFSEQNQQNDKTQQSIAHLRVKCSKRASEGVRDFRSGDRETPSALRNLSKFFKKKAIEFKVQQSSEEISPINDEADFQKRSPLLKKYFANPANPTFSPERRDEFSQNYQELLVDSFRKNYSALDNYTQLSLLQEEIANVLSESITTRSSQREWRTTQSNIKELLQGLGEKTEEIREIANIFQINDGIISQMTSQLIAPYQYNENTLRDSLGIQPAPPTYDIGAAPPYSFNPPQGHTTIESGSPPPTYNPPAYGVRTTQEEESFMEDTSQRLGNRNSSTTPSSSIVSREITRVSGRARPNLEEYSV